jgi:hypothetical protein
MYNSIVIRHLSVLVYVMIALGGIWGCMPPPHTMTEIPISINDSLYIMPEILFEVSSCPHIISLRETGLYVTRDGRIYRYVCDDPVIFWEATKKGVLTEKEFKAKHQKTRRMKGNISADTLKYYSGLIEGACKGPMSDPLFIGYDIELVTYEAYLFSIETSTYRPILLYLYGDQAIINVSDEARDLLRWLRSIDSLYVE